MRTIQDALNSAFSKWDSGEHARKYLRTPARHTGLMDLEPIDFDQIKRDDLREFDVPDGEAA